LLLLLAFLINPIGHFSLYLFHQNFGFGVLNRLSQRLSISSLKIPSQRGRDFHSTDIVQWHCLNLIARNHNGCTVKCKLRSIGLTSIFGYRNDFGHRNDKVYLICCPTLGKLTASLADKELRIA
jgi:hypothetical protein